MKVFADFDISAFQNPKCKILGFQKPEFKIMAHFKILAFQNPELKILAQLKILAFQNPELKEVSEWASYGIYRKVTQKPHFLEKCKRRMKRNFSKIV